MKPTTEELIDRLKEMNKGSYYYTVIKSNLQGRLDILEDEKLSLEEILMMVTGLSIFTLKIKDKLDYLDKKIQKIKAVLE